MSPFEWNKIFGAVLGSLLIVTAIGHIGNELVHKTDPETRGFQVEVAEDQPSSSGPVKKEIESVLPLLTTASVDAGAKVFKKCAACHTVDKGGAHKVGPNLWNIINANTASKDGFVYSEALKGLNNNWSYEELNKYLYKPMKYAPGTKMSFVGLKKVKDRANVIAYLRSLSDNPAELPTVSENVADTQ